MTSMPSPEKDHRAKALYLMFYGKSGHAPRTRCGLYLKIAVPLMFYTLMLLAPLYYAVGFIRKPLEWNFAAVLPLLQSSFDAIIAHLPFILAALIAGWSTGMNIFAVGLSVITLGAAFTTWFFDRYCEPTHIEGVAPAPRYPHMSFLRANVGTLRLTLRIMGPLGTTFWLVAPNHIPVLQDFLAPILFSPHVAPTQAALGVLVFALSFAPKPSAEDIEILEALEKQAAESAAKATA